MRRCCVSVCTSLPAVIPATATGVCTCCCSGRAGSATASGCNGCGVTRACTCHAKRAVERERRERQARSPPAVPTRCGRSTTSSTPLPTGGRSRSSTSPTSTAARPSPASINADQTVDVLANLVALREWTPEHIRCDNGPEFVAETLKEWCRFAGVTTNYIEPGAPWQNPYVESFNGHLRRELLDLESFNSLYEAQILLEDWRHDYNQQRPHQSLSYQTPAAFARQWHAHHQPAPS